MTASTLFDLVKVVSFTQGTGPLTLGAAVPGFLSPSTYQPSITTGTVVSYTILDGPLVTLGVVANSETGQGILTLTSGTWTLTRAVSQSTNNGNPINCSGNQIVALTLRAEDLAELGGGGLPVPSIVTSWGL